MPEATFLDSCLHVSLLHVSMFLSYRKDAFLPRPSADFKSRGGRLYPPLLRLRQHPTPSPHLPLILS